VTVGQAFNDSVEYYDEWMRVALPRYAELFSIAVDLIPFDARKPIDVLDLGAGTGLFSSHVWLKYPQASFVLCDIAPKMLDVARLRFQKFPGQIQFNEFDFRNLQCVAKFDVVISSLSIHHLKHDEKRRLFASVYSCLRKGGVFINIDQIKGPTKEIQEIYWSIWLQSVRLKGAAEDQIQASIKRRTEFDDDALLVDQLDWLSEAGFDNVDCVYKHYFIGVFFAGKTLQ